MLTVLQNFKVSKLVFPGISKGKEKNLKILGFFFQKSISSAQTVKWKCPNQSINRNFIRINKYIQPELLTIIVGNKLLILPRLIFIT